MTVTHMERKGREWWVLVEHGIRGWWGRNKDPYEARAQAMAAARRG